MQPFFLQYSEHIAGEATECRMPNCSCLAILRALYVVGAHAKLFRYSHLESLVCRWCTYQIADVLWLVRCPETTVIQTSLDCTHHPGARQKQMARSELIRAHASVCIYRGTSSDTNSEKLERIGPDCHKQHVHRVDLGCQAKLTVHACRRTALLQHAACSTQQIMSREGVELYHSACRRFTAGYKHCARKPIADRGGIHLHVLSTSKQTPSCLSCSHPLATMPVVVTELDPSAPGLVMTSILQDTAGVPSDDQLVCVGDTVTVDEADGYLRCVPSPPGYAYPTYDHCLVSRLLAHPAPQAQRPCTAHVGRGCAGAMAPAWWTTI